MKGYDYMHLKQRAEFRRLLLPQLRQSLKILAMPISELKELVEKELEANIFLKQPGIKTRPIRDIYPFISKADSQDWDLIAHLPEHKLSLQDVLLKQLGICASSDEEIAIGQEIIGNIDDNGYLTVGLNEIAKKLGLPIDKVNKALSIIQEFEPTGVGARNISECLLLQLDMTDKDNGLMKKIIELHLDDIAKKNYNHIAKMLKTPLENIELAIAKITKLNPKPGRNYSNDSANPIIPDITIELDNGKISLSINNEDLSLLDINKEYMKLFKDETIDEQTKELLKQKLRDARQLVQAVTRRGNTLRMIMETLIHIQKDAVKKGFAFIKPLTFKQVSRKIGMHETTVCRMVMNKYAQTPHGIIPLKSFFSSHIYNNKNQPVSSAFAKQCIRKLIAGEDKNRPLSDKKIQDILREKHKLKISRRTITKYREELKILSSCLRRQR